MLLCDIAVAQNIVITGKVLEETTKEPVPFANIGIEGETIGTVSNERGEYEFHVPIEFKDAIMQVSSIGYSNTSISIPHIKNQDSCMVYVEAKNYVLDAFEVRPKELTAEEIVKIAIDRLPANYISKSYVMDGFYREYFKENGKYVALAEAAVTIYDHEGYQNVYPKTKEGIQLNEIRVTDILNEGDYVLYIDINYALRGNLLRNKNYWKRFIKRNRFSKQSLKIDSLTYAGKDLVYSISFDFESPKSGRYNGHFFIRTSDYAVLRIELNALNLLKGKIVNGAPHKTKSVMNYRELNGKLYLSYINASHEVIYDFKGKRYFLNFFSELQVNKLETKYIYATNVKNRAEEKSIFYLPRYRSYSPEYWKDFNLFHDSPANAKIISDLTEKRPLNDQFRANGKLKTEKKMRAPTALPKSKYAPGASVNTSNTSGD